MSPVTKINIALGIIALIGFTIASFAGFPEDPVRSYLFVVVILLIANINLQYFFGLNMGVTITLTMPNENKKRSTLLFASWLMLAFIVYGAFVW